MIIDKSTSIADIKSFPSPKKGIQKQTQGPLKVKSRLVFLSVLVLFSTLLNRNVRFIQCIPIFLGLLILLIRQLSMFHIAYLSHVLSTFLLPRANEDAECNAFTGVCENRGICRGMGMSGGGYVQGWVPIPLMTPSGSHHMYGRQAGSTHPTRMLSSS